VREGGGPCNISRGIWNHEKLKNDRRFPLAAALKERGKADTTLTRPIDSRRRVGEEKKEIQRTAGAKGPVTRSERGDL